MDKKHIKFDDIEIKKYQYQYKGPILINDIDINEIIVFNKFPFCKQDSNTSLVTKIIKKLGVKTRCMCFMIKDKKLFYKYMITSEKFAL